MLQASSAMVSSVACECSDELKDWELLMTTAKSSFQTDFPMQQIKENMR